MSRPRAGRRVPRGLISMAGVAALLVAACADVSAPTHPPGTLRPTPGPSSGATTAPASLAPTPEITLAPSPTAGSSQTAAECSGNDSNRAFFAEAAAAMTWTVYCAVLPSGWFLKTGSYRLANGGQLEVTYSGPAGASLDIVEGNLCAQAGSSIDACAPRDALIGQAPMSDQAGELGQLSNTLVLDVNRGANPSWRITGLGVSEAAFRDIGAAMIRVGA